MVNTLDMVDSMDMVYTVDMLDMVETVDILDIVQRRRKINYQK